MTKKIFFLTIFFSVLFSVSKLSYGIDQTDKLSKAFKLFDSKRYTEAEPLFKELINEKPESLELYYYYGACRTENKNYSEYDLIQLLNADPAKAPQKINYYLGIQYQAQENWEQALKHYNKFRMNSTVEEQNDLDIAAKIQECYNHENPYKNLVKIVSENSLSRNISTTQLADSSKSEGEIYLNPDSTELISNKLTQKKSDNIQKKSGAPVEFIVNSRITYFNTNDFQTEEGRILFNESQMKQQKLDSILKKTDELREEYQASSSDFKKILGQKIVNLENETYPLKEEITNLLLQAQNKELDYWNNAPDDEMEKFVEKARNEKEDQQAKSEELVEENAEADSTPKINPEVLLSGDDKDILLEEPPKKDELIYRIQIGAYSKGLPPYIERLYKKLSVIRKIDNYTDENGVVVYTTGKLTNLEDAMKMQKQVRQEGVEDAYVVPYFNGKRITLGEAKKIEGKL